MQEAFGTLVERAMTLRRAIISLESQWREAEGEQRPDLRTEAKATEVTANLLVAMIGEAQVMALEAATLTIPQRLGTVQAGRTLLGAVRAFATACDDYQGEDPTTRSGRTLLVRAALSRVSESLVEFLILSKPLSV